MAQNEVQKYTQDQDLYANVRNVVETWYNTFDRLEKMSNFLNSAGAGDYPTVPAATLTALGGLRTQINSYLAASETVAMMAEVKKFVRI